MELKGYPALNKVLSGIGEPLFSEAEVEVSCWATMEDGSPVFHADLGEANLLLPEVTKAELDKIPPNFKIRVSHYFEDEYARATTFLFTFSVEIKGSKQMPDGLYELDYTAKPIDYESLG